MSKHTNNDCLRLVEQMKDQYEKISQANKAFSEGEVVESLRNQVEGLMRVVDVLEKQKGEGASSGNSSTISLLKQNKMLLDENEELKNKMKEQQFSSGDFLRLQKELEETTNDYNNAIEEIEELEEKNKALTLQVNTLQAYQKKQNESLEQTDEIEMMKRTLTLVSKNYSLFLNKTAKNINTTEIFVDQKVPQNTSLIQNYKKMASAFTTWANLPFNTNNTFSMIPRTLPQINLTKTQQENGFLCSLILRHPLPVLVAVYNSHQFQVSIPLFYCFAEETTQLWLPLGNYLFATFSSTGAMLAKSEIELVNQ
ncbi:hypothetical protein EIN_086060 [Entamoeba invadens IP1]|uniref:hypothetical protein n=1 Tax=Entamoeba invadens IP1 TaxID=370355 RepID=UPI0002C3DE3D|nr:hypothetical protein EIN_086060 [Entamoeba invadens IP1]ELP85354.1 hypothetical protein EIN_086060 [Entamoeba invadens IP1]|eukprot:XP_004184700.1 hypothetical protein EIN_086060 [Entamoeba invadens IP1]